jgi:archaellum component FlaC
MSSNNKIIQGLQDIISAIDSNAGSSQNVNVSKINSITPSLGNGITDSGCLRFTIATDDNLVTQSSTANSNLNTINSSINASNTALNSINSAIGTTNTDLGVINTSIGTTNTTLNTISATNSSTQTSLGNLISAANSNYNSTYQIPVVGCRNDSEFNELTSNNLCNSPFRCDSNGNIGINIYRVAGNAIARDQGNVGSGCIRVAMCNDDIMLSSIKTVLNNIKNDLDSLITIETNIYNILNTVNSNGGASSSLRTHAV